MPNPRRFLPAWALGLAVLATACAPKRVSDECQKRISACLEDCPPPPESNQGRGLVDSRTPCERACHQQPCP